MWRRRQTSSHTLLTVLLHERLGCETKSLVSVKKKARLQEGSVSPSHASMRTLCVGDMWVDKSTGRSSCGDQTVCMFSSSIGSYSHYPYHIGAKQRVSRSDYRCILNLGCIEGRHDDGMRTAWIPLRTEAVLPTGYLWVAYFGEPLVQLEHMRHPNALISRFVLNSAIEGYWLYVTQSTCTSCRHWCLFLLLFLQVYRTRLLLKILIINDNTTYQYKF